MKKRLVKNPFFRAFIFLFALELVAISINFFYAPINIAAGGATGMAVLLEAAFGFNRSLCVLVINTLMLILAWIFIDWKTVKKFIIGSYLLPVLIYVTPSFEIVSDKLLAVILAAFSQQSAWPRFTASMRPAAGQPFLRSSLNATSTSIQPFPCSSST